MHSELIHIYGSISIQWYGLMIFIGLLVFAYAVLKDPRRITLVSTELFFDLITLGVCAGVIGGRLLFIVTNRHEFGSFYDYISLWEGGFSVLGSVMGILMVLPLYLVKKRVPVLGFLDLVAIYAPLLQSVSRIGCFLAGCCYGSPTTLFWGVKRVEDMMIGQCRYVHPTQLYSAAFLFLIFLIMRLFGCELFKKPGQLTMLYLILESVERFVVDFWRGDREFFTDAGFLSVFSVHQFIAIGLCIIASIILVMITVWAQQKNEFV